MDSLIAFVGTPTFLKCFCLVASLICLWQAFRLYCLQWYRKKVEEGIRQAVSYLNNLKAELIECVDGDQLIDVVVKVPHKFTRQIDVRIGEDQAIDYQYELDLDYHLKSIGLILKYENAVVCSQFEALRNQLIQEIDVCVSSLQSPD